MDPEFFNRQLVHKVDIKQPTGLDNYGQQTTEFLDRIPCLVDAASGRRQTVDKSGSTMVYDYAVTLQGDVTIDIGSILEDARDEFGNELFATASVGQLRQYYDPRYGVVSKMALVQRLEEGSD